MRAVFYTFLLIMFWVLVGHFFPTINLLFTVIYFPFVLLLVVNFYKDTINMHVYIVLFFLLLLLYDYLYRIYGGGTHDDVARAICGVIFYLTFAAVTVTMLALKIKDSQNSQKGLEKPYVFKITKDILFVLFSALITLIIFRYFNNTI